MTYSVQIVMELGQNRQAPALYHGTTHSTRWGNESGVASFSNAAMYYLEFWMK
jgi:hypothetical protein